MDLRAPRKTLAFDASEGALPALFRDGLIFLNPKTVDGVELLLLADTGGGTFLYSAAAQELGLSTDGAAASAAPEWRPGRALPAPASGRWPVLEEEPDLPHTLGWSGVAGADWFAGGIWLIDYPGQKLRSLSPQDLPPAVKTSLPLSFQVDERGQPTSNFPVLEVEIDGRRWPVLLDTGAQSLLDGDALGRLGDGRGALRGTSFMAGRIFDHWRQKHPDWTYVAQADSLVPGSSMIRVPKVRLGKLEVGPVWWTRRPDENFDTFLSRWTEPAVVGAVGASAFGSLRLILSYPDRRLWLEPASPSP